MKRPPEASLPEGQRKKLRRSSTAPGGLPAQAVAPLVAPAAKAQAQRPAPCSRRMSSRIFRSEEPAEHLPAAGAGSGAARSSPTAQPSIRNASVEYVRSMMFEAIRDGEISDSERKMILWSIIVLAQVRDRCGDVRIPVPSSQQALGRYLETQAGVIDNLMQAVQGRPDEGVRESIFAERSPRKPAWVNGLDSEAGAPEGLAERAVASAAERGLGWLVHFAGTGELVQQVTAEELMLACEPPQEVDLCASHGLLLGALLGSLGPIVPEGYMFQARAVDFYRLCNSGRAVEWDLLQLALNFFLCAFLYAQLKKIPTFVVGALYLRVFICTFDENTWLLGRLVQVLRLVAQKLADWDKNDEWVGCPEDGTPSAIQWLPDGLAILMSSYLTLTVVSALFAGTLAFGYAYAVCRLRSRIALTLAVLAGLAAASVAEPVDHALDGMLGRLAWQAVQQLFLPVARGVLNYTFAVVLAKLLIRVLAIADEVVQPKLVLMSLKLGARARAARSAPPRGQAGAGSVHRPRAGA